MTSWDEGVPYVELYAVIAEYATRDAFHQVKALQLIRDNYTPFNNLPMDETKQLVEQIFKRNDYVIWYGGRPSLAGIDTIVTVAQWSGNRDWGMRLLVKMMQALLNGRAETYGLEAILEGMKALQG